MILRLQQLAGLMQGERAIYQVNFKISADPDEKPEPWTLDLVKNEIKQGAFESDPKIPKVIMTLTPADLDAIFSQALNTQMAFYTGRLKIKGDVLLVIKLQQVLARGV